VYKHEDICKQARRASHLGAQHSHNCGPADHRASNKQSKLQVSMQAKTTEIALSMALQVQAKIVRKRQHLYIDVYLSLQYLSRILIEESCQTINFCVHLLPL